MRLFISVPLPENVKEILSAARQKLAGAKLTVVKKEALHLTLKFLGDVSLEKAGEIQRQLAGVSFPSFVVRLGRIGAFPDALQPKVLWAGVEPAGPIITLHEKIEQALAGFFQKDERFHAHITLARVKFVENKKEFKELLKNISVPPVPFDVKSFELVSSTLTPKGPVYTVVGRFPL